jgi:hypothetical protein
MEMAMPKYRADVPIVTLRSVTIEAVRDGKQEAIERAKEIAGRIPESDLEFCDSWIGDDIQVLEPEEVA